MKRKKPNYNCSEKPNNPEKTNYLPWLLWGAGILALIVGLVWYFSKDKNNG